MRQNRDRDEPLGIQGLLGVGLDGDDGHVRISRGKNFYLVGGSQETHQRLQETALKINEKVDQKGKSLQEITGNEFEEIIGEVHPD